ncbi:MAG: YicC family protein [Clostridia bacterium]|nr:YicC family protein [Clostridia bacterium]
MVKSMTGYGRCEIVNVGTTFTVEVKSVNHRYFEFSCRTPRGYAFLEEKLKSFFASKISRGKVDVYLSIVGQEQSVGDVHINEEFAAQYISALKKLKKQFGLSGKVSLESVASNNEIFVTEHKKINEEEIWVQVSKACEGAVEAFVEMRKQEGAKLAEDVISRSNFILEKVAFVEKRSPETVAEYRGRLEQKIKELLGDKTVDEQRLLTEVAIFADKVAVAEETVRLRSHIDQLKKLIDGDEPVGRKLDFVVQEMNRETNTIGSKAQNIEIAHTVVEIKAEIEKIREQIQNIE